MEDNWGVLLCEYRQANSSKRLDMFMRYRDLRREFTKIERQLIPVSKKYRVFKIGRLPILRKIFSLSVIAKNI